jgi:hypothetical protein
MAKAMQLPLPGLDMDAVRDAGASWTSVMTECCSARRADTRTRSELRRLERHVRRLVEAGNRRRWTVGQMEQAGQYLAEIRQILKHFREVTQSAGPDRAP